MKELISINYHKNLFNHRLVESIITKSNPNRCQSQLKRKTKKAFDKNINESIKNINFRDFYDHKLRNTLHKDKRATF